MVRSGRLASALIANDSIVHTVSQYDFDVKSIRHRHRGTKSKIVHKQKTKHTHRFCFVTVPVHDLVGGSQHNNLTFTLTIIAETVCNLYIIMSSDEKEGRCKGGEREEDEKQPTKTRPHDKGDDDKSVTSSSSVDHSSMPSKDDNQSDRKDRKRRDRSPDHDHRHQQKKKRGGKPMKSTAEDRGMRRKKKRSRRDDYSDSSDDSASSTGSQSSVSDRSSRDSSSTSSSGRHGKKRKRSKHHHHRHDKDRRKKKRKMEKKHRKEKKSKKKKRSKLEREEKVDAGPPVFGQYGVIKLSDLPQKQRTFNVWLEEVKGLPGFNGPKYELHNLFKEYAEDYNTATLPHIKYYDYEKWELEEYNKAKAAASSASSSHGKEVAYMLEQQEAARKKREQEFGLVRSMMSKEKIEEMKRKKELQAEMAHAFKMGNQERYLQLKARLEPEK
jgi:hypothetical protein